VWWNATNVHSAVLAARSRSRNVYWALPGLVLSLLFSTTTCALPKSNE
jgi:hypothetical protein